MPSPQGSQPWSEAELRDDCISGEGALRQQEGPMEDADGWWGYKPGTPQETRAQENHPPISSFIFALKLSKRKEALLGKVDSGLHPKYASH